MKQSDLHKFLRWQQFDSERFSADLEFDGKKIQEAKLRMKGHTTRLFPKRGLSIKLPKKSSGPAFLNGLEELSLNPMFTDKSYMREKLTWDLFRSMQGFGPRALGYVHITLNGIDYGLYLAIQPVDAAMLKAHGKEGDDLFEARERTVPGNLAIADSDYLIESYNKKSGGEKNYSKLEKMINRLSETTDAEFATAVHELFNTESVYDWFSLNAITMQGDSYSKNYFLHYEPSKSRQWSTIPWDYDLSFGRDGNPAQPYPAQILNDLFSYSYPILAGPPNVLKDRLLKDAALTAEFKKHLGEVFEKYFNLEKLEPEIDKTARLIENFVKSEPVRWGTRSDFYDQVEALKVFINNRRHYLYSQFILNPVTGVNDEATLDISSSGKSYFFIDPLGKTLAKMKFSSFSGLKKITIKTYPSMKPMGTNTPYFVNRYIEVIPSPANATFKAELAWEYLDGAALTEVSTGVNQETGLQAYNIVKGKWQKLDGRVNAYSNTVHQTVSEKDCGKGNFFAAKNGDTAPLKWTKQISNNWHRWMDAKQVNDSEIMAVGDDGTLLQTRDDGATWATVFTGTHSQLRALAALNSTTLVATDQFGQIIKSSDAGKTWKFMESPAQNELNAVEFFNETFGVTAGANSTVLITRNAGETWTQLDIGQPKQRINSILILNENEILLAGDTGALFKSNDGAKTWAAVKTPNSASITSMVSRNSNEVWAATKEGKVVFSSDRGQSWRISSLQIKNPLHDIAVVDSNGLIVVGDGGSVFASSDGKVWNKQELTQANDVQSIVRNTKSNKLMAFGNAGSVFIRPEN